MDKVLGWFLLSCSFAVVSSGLAIVLWHTTRRALRAEALVDRLLTERTASPQPRPAEQHNMLESIATEVERLGEGQRFLTHALLERSRGDDTLQRANFRSVTPH